MAGLKMNKYVKRKIQTEIEKWIDRPEILAIRGPRQSGKSTLLERIHLFLIKEKGIKKENIFYINFEDKSKQNNFSKDPDQYIKSFFNSNGEEKYYFMLDEYQYIKDGGSKLKFLYDSHKDVKFIITGSSSLELTSKTIKYLVGRVFLFELYQFDFEEFLSTKENNIYNYYKDISGIVNNFLNLKQEKPKIEIDTLFGQELEKYFNEFCIYGGYPEAAISNNAEEKKIILENIFKTYIEKDIIDLLRLEDDLAFKNIVILLANRMANILEYSGLMADSSTYFKKLKNYLSILEETYIIYRLKPFFTNAASEIKKNPKIYFMDNGLRNTVINNYNLLEMRNDAGNLVENAVFTGLLKNKFSNIRYWRTINNAEVDFIYESQGKICPIEVKYSKMNKPHYGRSFYNFIKKYSPERGLILTRGFWGIGKIDKSTILFAPAWFL